MDGASVNDTFVAELAVLLAQRDIPFDAKDRRVLCFPHVINLTSQCVTATFTKPKRRKKDTSNNDDDDEEDEESDEDADLDADAFPYDSFRDPPPAPSAAELVVRQRRRDPVRVVRKKVRFVRASGQRRDHLQRIIRDGNEAGIFQLPQLQPLLDVRTRWDATHRMMKRHRQLRQVSNSLWNMPLSSTDYFIC